MGDLYRGRVDRSGAGDGGRLRRAAPAPTASCRTAKAATGVTEGEVLAVRVTRARPGRQGAAPEREADRGRRGLGGAGPPALLRRGPGAVERLAALHPDAPVRIDDHAALAELRPRLGDRITWTGAAFDDDVATQVEALANADLDLPDGSRLRIHPTPALVAIDVDAGAATGGAARQDRRPVGAEPRACCRRLRGRSGCATCPGAILVDFAGLPPRRRAALGPALAAALADDPLRPRLLGFTALGLAEIVRPRIHPPLHEMLAGPHAAGPGRAARDRRAALAADPGRPLPALRAAPAVVAALQADPVALPDLARPRRAHLDAAVGPEAVRHGAWMIDA